MERKIKMATMNAEFANALATSVNTWITPFAKYVVENYNDLSNVSVDDMIERFRSVLELPKPTGPVGVMGIAPSLNNASPKDSSKRTRAAPKKEAEESIWCTVEEYTAKLKDDCKICAYYSTRLKDERNEKVCGAPVSDTSNSDPMEWRCSTHKGKASNLKKISNVKSSTQGIDKSHVVPGMNVPNLPMGAPPLPIGLGSLTGNQPTPPLPPLPTMMPRPTNMTPPKIPGNVVIPPTPSPPKNKPKTPVPEAPIVKENPNLARMPGLANQHLIATNDALKNILLEIGSNNGTAVLYAIGKFSIDMNGLAPGNYLDMLTTLSTEEQAAVARFSIEYKQYVKPAPMAIPSIPGLPPLPMPL